ncbi:FAD-binding oxidoreductase [Thauera aromatica]|nr:FAD-binding oxidoreductase [Thauera aromatica]MCK2126201.1 FAD-binding oxidoreductase [Thauera aromatica]
MKLPKGVSAEDFNAALKEFRLVVGENWVFTGDEDMHLYRDAYSLQWGEPNELVASAAVAPENVEQVQAVVRIAGKYRIPLFAISTGKNLGYGGSAPNMAGNIIVDLKRMNKVIEVDDKRNFCIVEPGVSYFDLYKYIHERGFKVMMDVPDPGWGSPLGNAVDHGLGYTWMNYRDHFGSHCGMEVVLPDGEIMRTGMAAIPGSKTWAENKYGYGAYVDGLFAQSNFGIVTKMGFWMQPQPDHFLSGQVKVPKYHDLIPLINGVNKMEDQGLIGHPRYSCPMDPLCMQMEPEIYKPTPELMALNSRPGGATVEEYQAYAEKQGHEFWNVMLNFYGPKETVYANWEYAKKTVFAAIPGVRFEEIENYAFPLENPEAIKKVRHKVALGIPNMSIFSIGARSAAMPEPGDGHAWFSPIVPRNGEEFIHAHKVFTQAAREMNITSAPISVTNVPMSWQYRTYLYLFPVFVSRSDKERNRKSVDDFNKLIKLAAENGWSEYRTPPIFQDAVAATYSFNNNILLRFQERLKDVIDPHGIMAPGRGGIWPKRYREGA